MEINWTEKLKPDLKSMQNFESTSGCPMQSIDHEHYLLLRAGTAKNCVLIAGWRVAVCVQHPFLLLLSKR